MKEEIMYAVVGRNTKNTGDGILSFPFSPNFLMVFKNKAVADQYKTPERKIKQVKIIL